jgi:hypothetical protein
MTVSLKHTFQSAKTDSADVSLVQPSNWNQEHVLTAAAGKVLGRDTSGDGTVQELPISVTAAGNVTIPNNFAVTGTTGLTGTLGVTGTTTLTNLNATGTVGFTNALAVTSGGTGAATLPANNVLIGNGTSAVTAVAPGTAGNVLTSNGTSWASTTAVASSTLNAIATGSLANGSTVIINVDGTVSAAFGLTGGFGTETLFENAVIDVSSATYDASTQKVVIAYQDSGNSGIGTAVVGTVTGTSISFGTPVAFTSASVATSVAITYDANAQKVVVVYRDSGNSNFGTARVGTVSGTSISFGTAVVFHSTLSFGFNAVYDSAALKVVITYRDGNNSNFGTAVVGTVSGTNISFGTPVVFLSATSDAQAATYDSSQQKVVIAWAAFSAGEVRAIVGTVSGTSISFGTSVLIASVNSNVIGASYAPVQAKVIIAYKGSSVGNAVVGTVSGTSITFGSTATFYGSTLGDDISVTYDSRTQKPVVTFVAGGSSRVTVGTISGTSISFAADVTFQATASNKLSSTYDSVQQVVVIAYRRTADNFGVGITYQVPIATNLTSENFIGFSNAAYTNGQNATIQLVGAVDDAQTGLTPGQQYFVQTTGALGLTAGSPSVFAGTAVAATKIIVKG